MGGAGCAEALVGQPVDAGSGLQVGGGRQCSTRRATGNTSDQCSVRTFHPHTMAYHGPAYGLSRECQMKVFANISIVISVQFLLPFPLLVDCSAFRC